MRLHFECLNYCGHLIGLRPLDVGACSELSWEPLQSLTAPPCMFGVEGREVLVQCYIWW